MCTPSREFTESLNKDENLRFDVFSNNPVSYNHSPYQRKLAFMRFRIQQNLDKTRTLLNDSSADVSKFVHAYACEDVFLADLKLIHESLCSHGDEKIADLALTDLIRLVESFGFYLMHLDVRQESTRHSNAVAEILTLSKINSDYDALDETARLKLLSDLIKNQCKGISFDSTRLNTENKETLEVFNVIEKMHGEVSPRAFGEYVISMTHEASHIMEVMLLANIVGLAGKKDDEWFCKIRISPLFETIEDLNHIKPVTGKIV